MWQDTLKEDQSHGVLLVMTSGRMKSLVIIVSLLMKCLLVQHTAFILWFRWMHEKDHSTITNMLLFQVSFCYFTFPYYTVNQACFSCVNEWMKTNESACVTYFLLCSLQKSDKPALSPEDEDFTNKCVCVFLKLFNILTCLCDKPNC